MKHGLICHLTSMLIEILNTLQSKWFVAAGRQMTTSKIPPRVFLFLYCNLLSSFVVHAIANGTNSKTQVFKVGSPRSWGKGCDQGWPHCKQQATHQPSSLLPVEAEVLIFEDLRLAVVYPVIQKFKSIITSDPLGITKTWVGSDICSYRGFYCDNPPDNKSATALASIDFNGFQLGAPSIDGFLDKLPDIAVFHANSNNFAGTISTNIAKLPYLYELDVSNNLLSGPFPTSVVGMNSLTFLDLRFNFFSGSVPPQIFLQDLDFLLINNNNFMQNLPASLSNTHILYLTLANNKFSGPIPGGIVKALSSLTEVLLLNNSLSGCLPYELGSLDEAIVFDAGNNRLTGPIPFSLACLKNVEQLNFAGNLLYGMVPEVVCGLGNLVNLSLSDNYFTFVGPLCRILIRRGVLNIRNNCVPDLPFQRPIAECAKFLAFPRFCPRMWSYTLIPCMFPPFNPPVSSIPKYWPHFP